MVSQIFLQISEPDDDGGQADRKGDLDFTSKRPRDDDGDAEPQDRSDDKRLNCGHDEILAVGVGGVRTRKSPASGYPPTAVVKHAFRLREAFLLPPLTPSFFFAERNYDRRYNPFLTNLGESVNHRFVALSQDCSAVRIPAFRMRIDFALDMPPVF